MTRKIEPVPTPQHNSEAPGTRVQSARVEVACWLKQALAQPTQVALGLVWTVRAA